MNLKEVIEAYLQSVKMFELSELKKGILDKKLDQKFWRESILFWKKRIDETLKGDYENLSKNCKLTNSKIELSEK